MAKCLLHFESIYNNYFYIRMIMSFIETKTKMKTEQTDNCIRKIWFRPWYDEPREYTNAITIDYEECLLTIRRTITGTTLVNEQIYEIEEESFEQLLANSNVVDIKRFESLTEEDLEKRKCGQRDNWFVRYRYYEGPNLIKTEGILDAYYEGNPIEEIFAWMMEFLNKKE